MPRHLLATVGIPVLAAIIAASAQGGGGPAPGVVQGWDGIARGPVRYVAFATGTGTVVEAVRRRGGRVVRYSILPGSYGIPQVAFDGTTGGLSHDGRTLVLGDVATRPQLRKESSFAIVGVHGLRLRDVIRLRGDFSFDALSPGARMLYLIASVRLLSRLFAALGAAVRGRREDGQASAEYALVLLGAAAVALLVTTWATHTNLHALDTRNAHAVCIDLPKSWNKLDVGGMKLRLTPDARLVVRYGSGGRALAVVDAKDQRLLTIARVP